jgi:hypothetical protein
MIERIALALFALTLATPAAQAGWRLIDEGDCPGRQVIGSDGDTPDATLCTPAFAGKTALCFTQVCNPGCQYIDVQTRNCRGGGEMAQVYTCEPQASGQPESGGSHR